MSKIIAEKQDLINIADAIRTKTGKADSLSLEQMVTEIESIQGSGTVEELPDAEGVCFGGDDATDETYYKISGERLNDIADQVQRLAGVSDELTPEQMESNLESMVVPEELPDAEEAAFGLATASEEYAITINDASKIASYSVWGTYSIKVKYTVKEAFTLLGVRAYLVFNNYGTTIKVSINDEEKTAANIGYAQENKNDWTYRYFDTPINVSVGDVITLFQSSDQTKYPRYIPLSYATVNGKVELTYSYGGNGGDNPSMVHGIFDIIMAPVQAELPESYEIQRNTMDDIAEEIQRITGATTKLSTAQIIDALEDIEFGSVSEEEAQAMVAAALGGIENGTY